MTDKIKKVPTPTVTSRTTADEICMSVNSVSNKASKEPKTSGIKMRGAGAATKGTTCRGPMA